MRPETYAGLGKACLNIAVGLVIVGILQPYLSKQATLQGSSLVLIGILITILMGVLLPSKQGRKKEWRSVRVNPFIIIVGGTILIFGSFVLYAVLHHDKHQKHPR